MSSRKAKQHDYLKAFPQRVDATYAEEADIVNFGRTTRSAKGQTLFVFCPYSNKYVAYKAPLSKPKERKSYSPEPAAVNVPDQNIATPRRAKSVAVKRAKSTRSVSRRSKAASPPRKVLRPLTPVTSRPPSRAAKSKNLTSEKEDVSLDSADSSHVLDDTSSIFGDTAQCQVNTPPIPGYTPPDSRAAVLPPVSVLKSSPTPSKKESSRLQDGSVGPSSSQRKARAPPAFRKELAGYQKKFKPENVRRIAANRCVEYQPDNRAHAKIAANVLRNKNSHPKVPRKLVMINPVLTYRKKFSPMRFSAECEQDDANIKMNLIQDDLTKENTGIKIPDPQLSPKQLKALYQSSPVAINGRIAIEYDNFDVDSPCRLIKNLACFHEKHEELLPPMLKLAGWDAIKELNEGNAEDFYKNEFMPAIENLKKFQEDPIGFHDVNSDKYEKYFEDGVIIELPLPPKPEVFPFQIRKRVVSRIVDDAALENERIFVQEQNLLRQEEEFFRQQEAQEIYRLREAQEALIANIRMQTINLQNQQDQFINIIPQIVMPEPFLLHHPLPQQFFNDQNNIVFQGMNFQQPDFDEWLNNMNAYQFRNPQ